MHGKCLFPADPGSIKNRERQALQRGMQLTGKSVPKEGGVELSAFIKIIWKKNPGKTALPQGTPDFCFSPSTLRTAV